jgi:hypothetical protein
MTHWHIYNTFERLIFLCGYISVFGGTFLAICLIWAKLEQRRKAREKAKKPIRMYFDERG